MGCFSFACEPRGIGFAPVLSLFLPLSPTSVPGPAAAAATQPVNAYPAQYKVYQPLKKGGECNTINIVY
jgi:hypothetical protein